MEKRAVPVLTLAMVLLASGCATPSYVSKTVNAAEQRTTVKITEVETQVEDVQAEISKLHQEDERLTALIATASATAKDALERAKEAQKLAAGKFLWEVTLTDEQVRFGFNQSSLSAEAKAALDQFAQRIKSEDKNVYVEIQGHTDNLGSEAANLKLGQQRSEQVMRYLADSHGFPIHRMAVMSYGEARPIADNATAEGRSKNRRVTLVVLM